MYYLETNIISNKDIMNEILGYTDKSFTSSFAILEMLKGLNKNTYSIKREILLLLKKCNLAINWNTPEDQIYSSFPGLVDVRYEEYINKLKNIIETIYNESEYEEALRLYKEKSRSDFTDIDRLYTKYQMYVLNLFDANEQQILNTVSKDVLGFICNHIVEQYMIGKNPTTQESDHLYMHLYNIYNNKLDIAIKGFQEYVYKYCSKKPNKNDFIDIMHLLYLENRSCRIVTNDKKLSSICIIGERKYCLSSKEFLIKIK